MKKLALFLAIALVSCNKENTLKFVFSGGSGLYLVTYTSGNAIEQNYLKSGGYLTYDNPAKNSISMNCSDEDLQSMTLTVYINGKEYDKKQGTSISYTY